MHETTRVFALLGDASLRRALQQRWRDNGTTLCGMHAEGSDSLVEEMGRVRPHVVLVDVDVDGARPVIEAAASRYRIPVLAIVRAQQPGFAAMRPLEWGAVNLIAREGMGSPLAIENLEAKFHATRKAQVVDTLEGHFPLSGAFPDASVFDLRRSLQSVGTASKLVVIGAGVGGPMALRRILSQLRDDTMSPMVVALRFEPTLVPALVQWLVHYTGVQVAAAETSKLVPGNVSIVAPDQDAVLESPQGEPTLCVRPREAAAAPQFDLLFESAARTHGSRAVAVLLSAHGVDGGQGLLTLRRAGGFTMVQDRVSSVVYEAPGHAREGGGAIECLPINEIAERIQMLMRSESASHS